jgi:1,4-dihydroxy-2-naphthoyl-CoA synthase
LINQAVPRKDLDKAVDAMSGKLINKLPESLRYAKQQLNFWRDFSWSMTIGHAKDWLTIHTGSDEVQEGIKAFVQKRPVNYAGLHRSRSRK